MLSAWYGRWQGRGHPPETLIGGALAGNGGRAELASSLRVETGKSKASGTEGRRREKNGKPGEGGLPPPAEMKTSAKREVRVDVSASQIDLVGLWISPRRETGVPGDGIFRRRTGRGGCQATASIVQVHDKWARRPASFEKELDAYLQSSEKMFSNRRKLEASLAQRVPIAVTSSNFSRLRAGPQNAARQTAPPGAVPNRGRPPSHDAPVPAIRRWRTAATIHVRSLSRSPIRTGIRSRRCLTSRAFLPPQNGASLPGFRSTPPFCSVFTDTSSRRRK